MTAPAVVIGLDTIVGLQAARVLDGRGVPVIGIAADPTHYCTRTRSVRRVLAGPTAGSALIAQLTSLAGELDEPPVLVPCRDPSVFTISEHRDLLAPARILLPDHRVVRSLSDKATFAEVAASLGLPTPRTWVVEGPATMEAAAADACYPVVLKPAFRDDAWQDDGMEKGYYVDDAAALRAAFDLASPIAARFVVQEWVPGPHTAQYTCNALFAADGSLRATFVSQKVRQWPPGVGVGSMGIAVREDEVEALTVQLFGSVGFRGLAYLEVKRDERDGCLVIIEPNVGRPTGRSALADRCGVSLLYGMYREALGEPLESYGVQQPTRRAWVHLRSDLQAGMREWRHGQTTLGTWLGSYRRPLVDAVASLSDPGPLLADLARSARKAWRSARPRVSGRGR